MLMSKNRTARATDQYVEKRESCQWQSVSHVKKLNCDKARGSCSSRPFVPILRFLGDRGISPGGDGSPSQSVAGLPGERFWPASTLPDANRSTDWLGEPSLPENDLRLARSNITQLSEEACAATPWFPRVPLARRHCKREFLPPRPVRRRLYAVKPQEHEAGAQRHPLVAVDERMVSAEIIQICRRHVGPIRYGDLPPSVACGAATADSSNARSRIPSEPPNRAMASAWISSTISTVRWKQSSGEPLIYASRFIVRA